MGAPKLKDNEEPCTDIHKHYDLLYERATLTIRAVSKTGKDDQSVTILTGPKEHLYLGIDLPVTQRKSLKYDSATKTLQPQNDSPQLYLSINYYFGDLAGEEDERGPRDRFSVKVLALFSKRPLDSFGVAVGYQIPK